MDLTHKHMLMVSAELKKLKHELLGHTASLFYKRICGTNVVSRRKAEAVKALLQPPITARSSNLVCITVNEPLIP